MSRPKKRGGRFTPRKLSPRAKAHRMVAEARTKLAASPSGTIPIPAKENTP